jgi:hypothetical protein
MTADPLGQDGTVRLGCYAALADVLVSVIHRLPCGAWC